jgi:putative sigma-54 modulation protein
MEVTDRLRDYVKKKIVKLDRYLGDLEEARVELAFVKSARSAGDRQVAQLTVRGKGYLLRSEERSDDIFAAFDSALDKMQRQMERFKGKRQRGRGDGKTAAQVTTEKAPVVEEARSLIVRRKKFLLTPMDEEEALEQMVNLSHEDFFIFYNQVTNSVNVLYRRREGDYGLIETEIR